MAVPVQKTKLKSSKFVSGLSRYKDYPIIYWSEKNYLTLPTYKKTDNAPNAGDMFTVISPGQEFRPDKVSQEMYGTPDLWWRILEANNIKDIFEFKSGLSIRLPGNVFA